MQAWSTTMGKLNRPVPENSSQVHGNGRQNVVWLGLGGASCTSTCSRMMWVQSYSKHDLQAHGWQLHILRSRGHLRRLIWPTVFLKHSARWQEAIFIVWFQARGNLGELEGDIHRGTCMCSAFSMKKAVVREIQSCTARWNLPKNLKQKHYRSNPHQRTSFWSTVQTSLQISDSITSS